MASVFTKIIQGEIPCYKIFENDLFISFLDIAPLQKGHTLIVPKQEVDKFYEVEEKYLTTWMPFASKVAQAIEKSISCKRVGMVFAGLDVPHAHLHLIPIVDSIKNIAFGYNDTLKLNQQEFIQIQQAIIAKL